MLNKIIALLLIMSVFSTPALYAQGIADSAGKTRAKVEQLGTRAKVELKLSDGTKFNGRIESFDRTSVTIDDGKNRGPHTFSYAEISSIKKTGGISPMTWGIIGGAAAAAIIVGVTVIRPVVCDGGAGC